MSAIGEAVNALNDRLILAHAIGESLDAAGGETAPPGSWSFGNRSRLSAKRLRRSRL